MKFSPSQTRAIEARGDSLLVSAAAGSGKTAVLVERVIRRILSGGDISRLWLTTFTEAAASEMRLKIETALSEALSADPENEFLAAQREKLGAAHISTVHALCKYLVDRHFTELSLDPATAIGDEAEVSILFEQVLEDFVEELYEQSVLDPSAVEFIDFFSSGKNDKKLYEILKAAYRYYEETPFPQTDYPTGEDLYACFAGDSLHTLIRDKLSEAVAQYELALSSDYAPLLETKMWEHLAAERETLCLALDAAKARDFDRTGDILREMSLARWSARGKAYTEHDSLVLTAKYRRAYAKTLITGLQQDVFYASAEELLAEIRLQNRFLTALFSYVQKLDERFTAAKRTRGIISFADLERLALLLLVESYDPATDTLVPSEAARLLQEEIEEIIVDEYQDTNRKQDLIFRALSKEEHNIFMVGDVKQSIYRFRAAAPELFLEKKKGASAAESSCITKPSYLYLNQNFRSHPAILNFANEVFRAAMSARLGQIEYDEGEQLNTGGLYPETAAGHIELTLVCEGEESSDELAEMSRAERQAEAVADKILSLYGTLFYDVKAGRERPIEYGDIAILCRYTKNVAVLFERALQRRGIGTVNNNADQKFLELWEVEMLCAYLQVIVNPYCDIPLVTLLYSDFYCFSACELAAIRAEDKTVCFYEALVRHAQKDGKTAAFLAELAYFRDRAPGRSAGEMLRMLFARTHILERVASYPDGATRVANMKLLEGLAVSYETDSYKGLFSFIGYLEKLRALSAELPISKLQESKGGAVQILSVHKSKGLEYPVCFVVGLERSLTGKDKGDFISSRALGQALKMHDAAHFATRPSIMYRLAAELNRRDGLSEEMRILYVALTRPKTHLYLYASPAMDSLADKLAEIATYCGPHPAEFLADKPSMLKWLLFALRDERDLLPLYEKLGISTNAEPTQNCHFTLSFAEGEGSEGRTCAAKESVSPDIAEGLTLALQAYPYAAETRLPIKLSVSEVKGMRESDPEALPLIPAGFGRRSPDFIDGRTAGNVVGNALHKFMQFADFHALAANDGIEGEKERLGREEFLTPKELALVEPETVGRFVRQPLFAEMLASDTLQKEKRFFFTLPADTLFEDCGVKTEILLQGVLDCCYEKDGRTVIVDYKTDRLPNAAAFSERYRLQLELYREGLYRTGGVRAARLLIYSFHLDEIIEIS